MKAFMDKDFLLETPTAQHLYHDYSAKLPIVDYHCHIPPQEIYEDRRFENIAQVWLGGHQVLAGRRQRLLFRRPLQVARDALQRRARRVHHRRQARP